MDLSDRVVMVLSAQVQRQTNKTASEMLSRCLKFKSLPSLKLSNKSITTIRLNHPTECGSWLDQIIKSHFLLTLSSKRRCYLPISALLFICHKVFLLYLSRMNQFFPYFLFYGIKSFTATTIQLIHVFYRTSESYTTGLNVYTTSKMTAESFLTRVTYTLRIYFFVETHHVMFYLAIIIVRLFTFVVRIFANVLCF